MFTEPLSLDPGAWANAGAVSLPRILSGAGTSTYQAGPLSVNAGSQLQVVASHQSGKRIRSSIRLNYADNAGSTLISGTTAPRSFSIYLVADRPQGNAFTASQLQAAYNGLKGTLAATSDTLLLKWLNYEN